MADMADTFKGMSKIQLGIMAAVGLALIGFFALITLRVSAPGMAPLYTNLAVEDSGKIVSQLESMNVPYELRANGTEILVPSDKALRLRMSMAEAGLPSGGSVVGYEIFDKSDTFGSSQFVMNVNMLRALEGELARTIGSFKQVESARVHLVMPKRELFNREKQEPTASVAIKLKGAQELSKSEIAAVTHFVASAVPGLKSANVTVVDSFGRLLARGTGEDTVGALAASSEEYRVAFETRLKDKLEDLVEKIVGPGKVKVQVAADINFDRVVTNSEKFDPDGQVARSVQSTSEREDSKESEKNDTVSAGNQLPNAAAGKGEGGASNTNATEKSDETTNYEISKVVQNHVKEGGTVNKLSVAVLVDGNYTGEDKENLTYTQRSEEELQRINALVKSAIGFDEKRGDSVEVVNMQFNKTADEQTEESFLDSFKHELEGIVQTLIIAGVAILAILLVIRPAILHMIRSTPGGMAVGGGERALESVAGYGALAIPGGGVAPVRLPSMPGAAASGGGDSGMVEEEDDSLIDVQNVKGRLRSSTLKKVSDMVDKNPDETLNVMRQWMVREAS